MFAQLMNGYGMKRGIMKYFISKPASHKIDETLVEGIKAMDSEAEFVSSLCDADISVFQKGWTKSKICVADYHMARDRHIERREGYIYTDKYKVTLNSPHEK